MGIYVLFSEPGAEALAWHCDFHALGDDEVGEGKWPEREQYLHKVGAYCMHMDGHMCMHTASFSRTHHASFSLTDGHVHAHTLSLTHAYTHIHIHTKVVNVLVPLQASTRPSLCRRASLIMHGLFTKGRLSVSSVFLFLITDCNI